jgi:hypothetical protein
LHYNVKTNIPRSKLQLFFQNHDRNKPKLKPKPEHPG